MELGAVKFNLKGLLSIAFLRKFKEAIMTGSFAFFMFILSIFSAKNEEFNHKITNFTLQNTKYIVNIPSLPAKFIIKALNNIYTFWDFKQEMRRLKTDNFYLSLMLKKYESVKEQYESLVKLHETTIQNGLIYSKFADLVYANLESETFYINKGKNQDIEPFSLVLNENGVVGRIEDVYDNYSIGYGLLNQRLTIPVKVQGKNVNAILKVSGNQLVLEQIETHPDFTTQALIIEEKDVILTSPILNLVTENLPIGVVKMHKDNIIIQPFATIKNSHIVAIISPLYEPGQVQKPSKN
jgi:cell shape-determining protein MreC